MEDLVIYILKVGGLLSIFYLSYALLLRQETSFELNRKFFLAGLLGSLILPLIYFTKKVYIEAQSAHLNALPAPFEFATVTEENSIDWWQVAGIVYLIVSGFLLLRLILQLSSIFRLIFNGRTEKSSGYRFLKVYEEQLPFSFFNFIVFNPEKHSDKELKLVLEHEKVHARQLHSADILLINLVSCFLWFNPFTWLYRKAMEQNLEFIADRETVRHKAEIKEYQHALVKVSVTNMKPALTNHFYQSFIKKRILMLNKKSSNHSPAWKLGLVMPLVLAFMLLFNVKTEAQVVEKEQVSEVEIVGASSDKDIIVIKDIDPAENNTKGYKEMRIKVEKVEPSPEVKRKADVKAVGFRSNQSQIGINPLYVINGKTYKASKLRNKYVRLRSGLQMLPSEESVKKYGEDAKNGAVIITDAEIIRNFDKELDEIKGRDFNGRYLMVGDNGKPTYLNLDTENRRLASHRTVRGYNITGDQLNNAGARTIVIHKNDSAGLHREMRFGNEELNAIQFSRPDNFSQSDDLDAKVIIGYPSQEPLFVVDDEIKARGFKASNIDPNNIASMKVLKGESAVKEYGEKGEHGVIIITMKKPGEKASDSNPAKLYELHNKMTDTELEALKLKLKEEAGMDLEISDIKRNQEGKINEISLSGKKDGKSASATWSTNEGIPPIKVGISQSGSLILSSN
ncbi:M56 family metallopeptidase [Gramella sp. GC03-9]|uniref:M56 family metallopeptidase n=1 Tax=Christiangramia oceanisediminis TaxID=2920386 RepID=A0A9X2I0H2_9FLAO|nr:M56 family metallopeptidase [Gramella oceanisediminis]MCP9198395.1 M56 family metallopeptidase [Gramella oceanisediminis]